MKRIYDLKENKQLILSIQKASTTTTDFGLDQEYGLFGSSEWWSCLYRGDIKIHEIKGVITKLEGDLPAIDPYIWFFIKEDNQESRWPLEGDSKDYIIGKEVLIKYVLQKRRKKIFENDDLKSEVIISIDIGE